VEGRVAIVTGASRGIGTAIAQRFAAAGAAVAVSARTVEEGDHAFEGSITTTLRSIVDAGGTAIAVAADLSKEDDRLRLVNEVNRQLGPVDILVNNAAITYFAPVDSFTERHYRLMFEVQVRAPFELAQMVIPQMRERGAGWILNISSGAAMHPRGDTGMGGTVYGMCKAALERFSTGLASELKRDNIAVNALSPSGLVLTPGVVHHKLDQFTPKEHHEPVELMAEAAFALCAGDPTVLTGRIAYAKPLLDELGIAVDASR
jgi:NAD(P)-dependent dehydrogenase (short-subunit alcohol dehydrogenase family)